MTRQTTETMPAYLAALTDAQRDQLRTHALTTQRRLIGVSTDGQIIIAERRLMSDAAMSRATKVGRWWHEDQRELWWLVIPTPSGRSCASYREKLSLTEVRDYEQTLRPATHEERALATRAVRGMRFYGGVDLAAEVAERGGDY